MGEHVYSDVWLSAYSWFVTQRSHDSAECALGAEREALQVLEKGEYGSLGIGTCLSLSLIRIFSLPECLEVLPSFGATGGLALPRFHAGMEALTIPALAVTGRSPRYSTLCDVGLCPLGGGRASVSRRGWRSSACISLLRLLGGGGAT